MVRGGARLFKIQIRMQIADKRHNSLLTPSPPRVGGG